MYVFGLFISRTVNRSRRLSCYMSLGATAVCSAPGVGETQLLALVLRTTQKKRALSDLGGMC